MAWSKLDKVPEIAERITENSNTPIVMIGWRANNRNAVIVQSREVTFEIIGCQKKENPPPGLIADSSHLFFVTGTTEDKSRTAAFRLYCDPSFPFRRQIGILNDAKAENAAIKAERLIVVRHDKLNAGYSRRHAVHFCRSKRDVIIQIAGKTTATAAG